MGNQASLYISRLARLVLNLSTSSHLCRHAIDTRYSEAKVSTHDRSVSDAVSCSMLMDRWSELDAYDVIAIDEGQFFPDLVEFADRAGNAGKRVIVASLDATFERKEFGQACQLLPVAEQVTKLSAVCTSCGAD